MKNNQLTSAEKNDSLQVTFAFISFSVVVVVVVF